MKIDIGQDGKILGTKRVSSNGQISGFTEYAGAEVLVILPGGSAPVVRRDARDLFSEVEKVVEARMKLAFQEYKTLRRRYGSPKKATDAFLKTAAPKNLRGVIDRADAWLREQARLVERRVEERLNWNGRTKDAKRKPAERRKKN